MTQTLIDGLEKFVCAIYGKSKYDSVDEVRHFMLRSKCDGDISVSTLASSTVDMARFPPTRACLREHCCSGKLPDQDLENR